MLPREKKKAKQQKKKVTAVAVTFFVELRCNAAPHQAEEGDGSNATVAFFFFFFSYNTKKKKKVTTTLLPSPSFLRYSTTKQALQRSIAFFAMLHWSAAIAFFSLLWSCAAQDTLRCISCAA
jgi:hypothetical protein